MTTTSENALCEITILPDGRVYVFGMSRPVLEVLQSLGPEDSRIQCLLEQLRRTETATSAGGRSPRETLPAGE